MGIPKPKRVKKTPLKKLKLQLDKLMSQYVILRDKACVICGKTDRLTNGHLFTRGHMSTRWDFMNCWCQCVGCNFYHELDPSKYTLWFINKFDTEEYCALADRFNDVRKWDREALEDVRRDLEHKIYLLQNV